MKRSKAVAVKRNKNGLTPKQQSFVEHYLQDFNGTQAAIRAGYKTLSAPVIASRMLARPAIAAAVKEGRDQILEDKGAPVSRIIDEYCKIAFLDPSEFYDADGKLIPVHQLPKHVSAAIAGMDVVETGCVVGEQAILTRTRKVKISDKIGALNGLARIHGMFQDKVEVSGSLDLAQKLKEARERARKQG